MGVVRLWCSHHGMDDRAKALNGVSNTWNEFVFVSVGV